MKIDSDFIHNELSLILVTFVIFFLGIQFLIMPSYSQEPNQVLIRIPQGAADDCQEEDCFIPSKTIATAGDTVAWQNDDTVIHRIVSGNVSDPVMHFAFPALVQNEMTLTKFYKVGKYPYICSIHPWMRGDISIIAPEGLFSFKVDSFEVFGEINGAKINDEYSIEYHNYREFYDSGVRPIITIYLSEVADDGILTIAIPRGLMDSVTNGGDDFAFHTVNSNSGEISASSENFFREIRDDSPIQFEKSITMSKLGKSELEDAVKQYRLLEIPFSITDKQIRIYGTVGRPDPPIATITNNIFYANIDLEYPEKNIKYRIEQASFLNLGNDNPENKYRYDYKEFVESLSYNIIADNITSSSYDVNIFPGNKYYFRISVINDHGMGKPGYFDMTASWDSIINYYPLLLEPGIIEVVIFIFIILIAIIVGPIIFLRMRKAKRILKLQTIIDLKDE